MIRFIGLFAICILLCSCSFYIRDYRTADLEHRTVFIGFGEFLHFPHGLRVQDTSTSAPVLAITYAEFVKLNPLYGESEPTRNLYEIAASLFGAMVSVVTLLF